MFAHHALVTCRLPVIVGQAATAERLVRGWRRVDCDVLRRALEDSPLCHPVADDANVDELFAEYENVRATSPTVWRRYMPLAVPLVVRPRGSTPAVVRRDVTAVVWSDATVARAAPTIVVAGSTQLVVVFGSTGLRKRRTGWTG